MYGLKPVPFVCPEIDGIPHLKIEMWGTRLSMLSRYPTLRCEKTAPKNGALEFV
jgi:hypothetical protein